MNMNEENALINEELIMKAWKFLRDKEMTIPNETLDFMREVALEKLKNNKKFEKITELFGWDLNKNLNDFILVAENLEKEGHISRSNVIRYLIERCKISESKSGV